MNTRIRGVWVNFIAIDVETANADMSSICQIGIAKFRDGKLSGEWVTYLDPQTYFSDINISIHGIDRETIQGAPNFQQVFPDLSKLLRENITIIHTPFDRVAIQQAAILHNLNLPEITWLDTARVARRAWSEFSERGYGLANVCRKIGYEFQHHDALEDAKAAGEILLAASRETNLDLTGWAKRVKQSIDLSKSSPSSVKREGNPDGLLSGEVIVFTGQLQITKNEAADLAAKIGCDVGQGVTKKTTLLCVGNQGIEKLAGHSKSSKHRKAESLIAKGQNIKIIREADFMKMLELQE